MNWKFWKKETPVDGAEKQPAEKQPAEKLQRPKDIPEAIGMHMVATLKKDPDWVWTLKAAMLDKPDSKDTRDIRIFDPAKTLAAKVDVRNYHTLDTRPELILYEGWFNKKNRKFQITEKTTFPAGVKAA